MYTDIIFDFDGTVSDSYPLFTEALLEVLEDHGLRDTYDSAFSKLKISVGYAISCYKWDVSEREISREFNSIHEKLAFEKQKLMPGADKLLKEIADLGKRSYLYTHTGLIAYKLLFKMGVIGYFTDILDGTLNFKRKPCPDAINWLIEEYDLDRSKTLMVGDRDIDIEAGHNAGIDGCLLDPDAYYPDTSAEFKVLKLEDIIQIL